MRRRRRRPDQDHNIPEISNFGDIITIQIRFIVDVLLWLLSFRIKAGGIAYLDLLHNHRTTRNTGLGDRISLHHPSIPTEPLADHQTSIGLRSFIAGILRASQIKCIERSTRTCGERELPRPRMVRVTQLITSA